MKSTDILKWFQSIANTHIAMQRNEFGRWYDQQRAVEWLTEAHSALESVFPRTHAVLRSWEKLTDIKGQPTDKLGSPDVFDAARGVFKSAYEQLQNGRLATLTEGILAASVTELLDQAQTLRTSGYLVAAAVIAGGALESHLLHLCTKHQLTWASDGSIAKYDGAIGQARNAGTEIYSVTYGKLVTAWGGIRNEAAHTPKTFARSSQEVDSMIMGIREFVARHS